MKDKVVRKGRRVYVYRTCITCKKQKPISEYRDQKCGRNGRAGQCRSCYNTYMKDYCRRSAAATKVARAMRAMPLEKLLAVVAFAEFCQTSAQADA